MAETGRHRVGRLIPVILAVLFASVSTGRTTEVLLDSFSYSNREAAANAWRAMENSPPPVPANGTAKGLVFPCPFLKNMNRAFWDHPVLLNLSKFTSFELDISCAVPSAIRSLAIYFRSGNGWYVWNTPLDRAGRQKLHLLKQNFSTEGTPDGWRRIDRIRISPWKGASFNTSLTAHSLVARNDLILLVQGTLSAPAPSEKRAARRAAQRLSRWLNNMDISHGLLTDEEVTNSALGSARIVILCYNPKLPVTERKVLDEFVKNGGKLIVFYSADAELARLMHLKLGPYTPAGNDGEWTSFIFMDPDALRVPKQVFQKSWNIRPVHPADDTAHAIAYWTDFHGKKTRQPAWVASKQGLWMTHILLDDDARNKKALLLGLLAEYAPGVWRMAAWNSLHNVGRIDSFQNLGEAVSSIGAQARGNPGARRTASLLKKTQRLFHKMLDHYEAGDYPRVVENGRELRENLIKAYAMAQTPREGEFRGVWDHDAIGWFPGNWDRTCRLLARHGITTIFPNVAWAGVAHYNSKLLPHSDTFRRFGDQLAACTEAAHKHGIEVHAWKICWNLDGAPENLVRHMEKESRLQTNADGQTIPWLCPSHPKNRQLEISCLAEMAAKYNIDGLHLDYIRFPESKGCYCKICRTAFEHDRGKKAAKWPDDVLPGGSLTKEFRRWRAQQITDFVRTVRKTIRKIAPETRISAAVFGDYPACVESVGQDWGTWLKKDLVDFVCPMNYTDDPSRFAALTRSQLQLGHDHIYPGIGVTAAQSRLTPDQVIEQIVELRKQGAPGFMLFKLDPTLRNSTLPILSLGVTR